MVMKMVISLSFSNVDKFLFYFPGSKKAQLQKANRWWRNLVQTIELKVNEKWVGKMCMSSPRFKMCLYLKVLCGKGMKR